MGTDSQRLGFQATFEKTPSKSGAGFVFRVMACFVVLALAFALLHTVEASAEGKVDCYKIAFWQSCYETNAAGKTFGNGNDINRSLNIQPMNRSEYYYALPDYVHVVFAKPIEGALGNEPIFEGFITKKDLFPSLEWGEEEDGPKNMYNVPVYSEDGITILGFTDIPVR